MKKVDSDPEFYLGQIQEMLMNKTYTVSDYSVSTINDKGKDRELMKLPYFPDRIIQWAILLQIEKVFVKYPLRSHLRFTERQGNQKGNETCR